MGAPFVYALATPRDEAELRRLLRENPMPGAVSLTLEREPDFFRGAAVEGSPHQTLVARERPGGPIVALASRSQREVWVNGERRRIGYLSQGRIDRRYRSRRSLLAGMAREMRALHRDGAAPFYYSTIIADNRIARRLFEGEWGDKPGYRARGSVVTLAVPLWRRFGVRPVRGLELRSATEADRAAIAGLLAEELRRFQLAPVWRGEDLDRPQVAPDLRLGDFVVAAEHGRIVACLALWDQHGFKQSVVRGYDGWLGRARPLLNGLARLGGAPKLPAPGEPLRSVFLSHVAVAGDRPDVATLLVVEACNRLRQRGVAFATLGFGSEHPLLVPISRAFVHLTYRSVLYTVAWPDGADAVATLDHRPAHVEVATL